jgi:hypothetical protein
VIFLPKDRDDVERRAAGERYGDEFEGLGPVPPAASSSSRGCSLPVLATNWRSALSG